MFYRFDIARLVQSAFSFALILLVATGAGVIDARGQFDPASVAAYSEVDCPACESWNEPSTGFHLYGNTYYVGTRGLAVILLVSDEGHILLDGGLPASAPQVAQNIRALGFRVEDVRLIVNSHAHFDHAGGISALQSVSGARVAASPASAPVLASGKASIGDPQYGVALDFPAADRVEVFAFGDTLRVGPIAIHPLRTPGHTPGGTSWTWTTCENGRCLNFVYADSQTPVSADGFRFTDDPAYPNAMADFEHGFRILETVACDVLITPHPSASRLWERVESDRASLVDSEACKRYASAARARFARRIQEEGP